MRIGFWLGIIAVAVALAAGWFAVDRLEGSAPRVTAPDEIIVGQAPKRIEIGLEDTESGIRGISARLLHEAGSRSLLQEAYPGDLFQGGEVGRRKTRLVLEFDAASAGAPDGNATLVLQVRDWSWRDGLSGNRNEVSIPVVIDTRPPDVAVESGITYVHRGGSAAAVYSVGEPVDMDGVQVGDSFFPGYPHPSGDAGRRIAIFAVPVEAPAAPQVDVIARDRAGNQGSSPFPAKVLESSFRDSQITISEDFVNRVATPLARNAGLDGADPGETFRRVNEDLRSRSETTIRESLAASNQSEKLWDDAFEQLENSQVTSRFAEHRTYVMDDLPISQARHYGFDLASVAQAPITAAAAGVVAYAGDLGIYGGCVVIDHGLGVASLYGHLSKIDVRSGEKVRKGQTLGRSGRTGLAGGDHLHFAILVGDDYVNPLEWWDPKWLRSHIDVRLDASKR